MPGEDLVSRFLVDRQRFAGDRRLVQRALAFQDDSVGGDVVTGPHADDIADRQVLGRHLFLARLCDAPRFSGGKADEGFNRGAGPFGRAGLDDFTHDHEKRNHPGGLVIGRGKGGQDGDGDQFVDAEQAAVDVLDGGPDDGVAEHDGAHKGAHAGHGLALVQGPIHNERVQDTNDSNQGLPQADCGVLVVFIVAARRTRGVVLVPAAKERGDLHIKKGPKFQAPARSSVFERLLHAGRPVPPHPACAPEVRIANSLVSFGHRFCRRTIEQEPQFLGFSGRKILSWTLVMTRPRVSARRCCAKRLGFRLYLGSSSSNCLARLETSSTKRARSDSANLTREEASAPAALVV